MTNLKPEPALMKICSICGIQKPLSAFLQMSGTGGGFYGSICNSCRRADAEKKRRAKTEAEGSTTVQTGRTIDAKSKIESDLKRREDVEAVEEEYHEDRDKDEILEEDRIEKKTQKAEEEKKQREGKEVKQKPTDDKEAAKAAAISQLAVEEEQKTDMSLNLGPVDFGRVAQRRFTESPIFSSFKSWLGTGAAIVGQVEKAALAATHAEKLKGTDMTQTAKDGLGKKAETRFLGKKVEAEQSNPLIHFAENTWGPGKKK